MKHFLTFVVILTHSILLGQITDDFSDGDFTTNPTWSGTTADYMVNGSFELQLNNIVAATSYLSTPHGLTDLNNKEWSLWTSQTFAPSGSNYGRVYLTSSSADLTTDPDGFYLQLGEGGSNDAVRLFKVSGGVHTELLAGPLAQIAASFAVGIRVVRDNAGNWSLYIDPAGGTSYALAGTVNDATNLLGTHYGFLDVYTVSNATKFYYDNIYVGDEILDTAPPVLVSAIAINTNQVDLQFDEALDQTSAELSANYSFNPALTISGVTLDGVDPSIVHVALTTAMTNGTTYTVTTNNIADLSANISGAQNANFGYFIAEVPAPGDVIINEFLCDEEPSVGLPKAEFVELYNRSNKIFDLSGWKIADAASEGTIQQAWLLPDSYIVICGTSDIDSFNVVVGATSFPSLNNSGDAIVLKSDLGDVLDSINYNTDWYQDPTKEGGGYSIELINPNDPCSDQSNWMASNDPNGGTPELQNSVYDITPDVTAPSIVAINTTASNVIDITFSEDMDSTSLVNSPITTLPGLTVNALYVADTFANSMLIQFVETFTPSQIYTIELQNAADCWMNSTTLQGTFALPEAAIAGDIVINEIMFNPLTGGSDWVELYNNSNKMIDLSNWSLANYDNDTIDNVKSVGVNYLFAPDDYLVLTEDDLHIMQNYPAAIPNKYIVMDLPTFSNDSGTVYLLQDSTVLDKVSYEDDWHFKLLDDDDGKSLERLDPEGNSDTPNNWHTAAEAIGFATPGRVNSQFNPVITNGTFEYDSEIISPDNDGFEDVLQIVYEMNEAGYVGSFEIYDDRGRFIVKVMDAELLGSTGSFTWDGVNDDGTKATIGTYVGVFEAFDIDGGAVYLGKKAFTLAGKL